MEFPRVVFKCPGPNSCQGGSFKNHLVKDVSEFDDALSDGWHATLPEALAVKVEPKKEAAKSEPKKEAPADEDLTKLSRGQLMQKARDLGLAVSPNIGETKLLAKILAAQP